MTIKNKKYKALMLDLDGTTIPNRWDGMPSQRVIEAVAKARKKIHVSVVTGRPYTDCEHIIKILQLTGPSIVAGGAEIRDSERGDLLWSKTITDETTKKILDFVNKKNLKLIVVDYDHYKKPKLVDPDHLPKDSFLMSIPDLTNASSEILIHEFKHISEIVVHKVIGWEPDTIWLQITHSEATKQHGIFEAAKIMGISTHEIIGVGDSYNDFPLFMACGLRVAVGNAVEDLKEIADYIAPSVEDDGVADVIEKFVL